MIWKQPINLLKLKYIKTLRQFKVQFKITFQQQMLFRIMNLKSLPLKKKFTIAGTNFFCMTNESFMSKNIWQVFWMLWLVTEQVYEIQLLDISRISQKISLMVNITTWFFFIHFGIPEILVIRVVHALTLAMALLLKL